jgi:methoxymalonate biosynthesis acyl carrier protein
MKELELKESVRNFLTKHINVEFEDSDNFFEKRYVNSLFAMQLVNYLEQ